MNTAFSLSFTKNKIEPPTPNFMDSSLLMLPMNDNDNNAVESFSIHACLYFMPDVSIEASFLPK